MTTTPRKSARKPAQKVFGVLCRRSDGVETRHTVRATSEADAKAKIEANLKDTPLPDKGQFAAGVWTVVRVEPVAPGD